MGGVPSETMTTKKKKKGRPSLLDLQKRSLKQQQEHPQLPNHSSPNLANPSRRPNRRNSVYAPEWIAEDDEDEDEERHARKKKKHKLLIGLNSQRRYHTQSPNSASWGSDSIEDGDQKRRRISLINHGSDQSVEKFPNTSDDKHGTQVESGPTIPLPDKKLLVFILDRLQKKDTHGVFSEPVDPEELPDYHDIIEHPMDFGTVRKKLDGAAYGNLEEFEKDVLLICSNALQYNAPDTIYFRQARAMQELARKDFANLRQESDDSDPQPKIVRRGRPPGKSSKKSLVERVCPDTTSDAILASAEDNDRGSNSYNLRKALGKFQFSDSSIRASNNNPYTGNCANWTSELENEFPASVMKAVLKYGKKQHTVDETRRDTYMHALNSEKERPLLATVAGESKQLTVVGLHVQQAYARSLARFAADLGPVAWKIASKKINRVLPSGQKFGPGWIEEIEMPETTYFSACDEDRPSSYSVREDLGGRLVTQSEAGTLPAANGNSYQSGNLVNSRSSNPPKQLTSLSSDYKIESNFPFKVRQQSMVHNDVHGVNGESCFMPQMRMVRLAEITGLPSSSNDSRGTDVIPVSTPGTSSVPRDVTLAESQFPISFTRSQSGNLAVESGVEYEIQGRPRKASQPATQLARPQQNSLPFSANFNLNIAATNSSTSNAQTSSRQQPDLALQL